MDWILSFISMIMLWFMGNKNKYAPFLGIIGQMLWIYYAASLKQYGLLVGTIGYLIIHVRNAYKWNEDWLKNKFKSKEINHICTEKDLKYESSFEDGLFDLTWYKCRVCNKKGVRSDFIK